MVYKLGELLEQVTEANIELKYGLSDIVGVTITKKIIPTIANLKETDLSKFIIVRPKDFIYNPRTHGKKIGLGYNMSPDTYIATWNNNIFRIKEEKKHLIDSDYLYLYFCREKWDKEACFNAWGSSTVVLLWENFCNIRIDLPNIDKQKEIVYQYKAIEKEIDKLQEINVKLENFAEMYYKTFTSCEENIDVDDIAKVSAGGDNPKDTVEKENDVCKIPVYSNGNTDDGLFGYTSIARINEPSITISARGNIGYTVLHKEPYTPIVRLISITPYKLEYLEWLYFYFKNLRYDENGTSQQQVTIPAFKSLSISIPNEKNIKVFHDKINYIFEEIDINKKIIDKFKKIQNIMIN